MKKFLLYIFIVLLLIFGALYALLFTQMGNNILKPTVESKLTQAIQKKVDIETFSLRLDSLTLRLKIDSHSFLALDGTFNLFKRTFDAAFQTSLKDIAFDPIMISSKMLLQGSIKGDMNNFTLLAKGNALKGDIEIEAQGTQESLHDTKVALKQIDIKELLAIIGKPAYAEGVFDLTMDIKEASKTKVEGNSDFKLLPTKVNATLLAEDFKVNVPKDIIIKASILTQMSGQKVISSIDIDSSLATLKTKQTTFSLATQTLLSDYALFVSNFSKLEPIIGMKLKGEGLFVGDVSYSPTLYSLTLKSSLFDGQSTVKVENDTLEADISRVKLAKIMTFLDKPVYSSGELSVRAKLSSLKELKGVVIQTIDNGKVDTTLVNKDFNQTLPKNVMYSLKSDTIIEKGIATLGAQMLSSLANLTLSNTTFDMKKEALNSEYKIDIEDLSALKTIAKQDLRGSASVQGVIKTEKEKLYVDGKSSLFGGTLNFVLDKNIFKANMKEVKLSELLYTLFYPDFFTSTLFAELEYDLKNAKGVLRATSNDGRFKQNQFGTLLLAITGIDITNEIYKNVLANARIEKEELFFDTSMNSQNTTITLDEGYIHQGTEQLKGKLKAIVLGKEYLATLSGTTSSPKVKLDAGAAAKEALKGKIEKNLPENTKNLLKGFGF